MKTVLEITNELGLPGKMFPDQIDECHEAMRLYAEQALDAAAENATLWVETPINGTEFSKIEEDLSPEDFSEEYLQTITVFKDSILKLKDQLK